jgi:hypothetical protein
MVSLAFEPPGPEGADLFVRPLQGRVSRWAHYPWAAGTKACPRPRLLNLNPFGVQNPSLDFLSPGVQLKIWMKISARGEGCGSMEGSDSNRLTLSPRGRGWPALRPRAPCVRVESPLGAGAYGRLAEPAL